MQNIRIKFFFLCSKDLAVDFVNFLEFPPVVSDVAVESTGITLSPNPAEDVIRTSTLVEAIRYTLSAIQGYVLKTGTLRIGTKNRLINISSLPKGIDLPHVEASTGGMTKKVVKR